MGKVSEEQYNYALERIEHLLPLVDGYAPKDDPNAIELSILSDVVIEYEKEYYPIDKPSVGELIETSLNEKNMTQKELADEIGVSPSRISDFVSGRAIPNLRIASMLCSKLGINPSEMMGI